MLAARVWRHVLLPSRERPLPIDMIPGRAVPFPRSRPPALACNANSKKETKASSREGNKAVHDSIVKSSKYPLIQLARARNTHLHQSLQIVSLG